MKQSIDHENLARDFLKNKLTNENWYRNIEKNIKAVVLYGSVAKGTNKPDSDIDLLIILPLEDEEKFTDGEYFIEYGDHEFNIVMRSVERLRKIAHEEHDQFQTEVFRNSLILLSKGEEVKDLIGLICQTSSPETHTLPPNQSF